MKYKIYIAIIILISLLNSVASAVRVKASMSKTNPLLTRELKRQNTFLKNGNWFSLIKEYRTLMADGNAPSDFHFLSGRLYYTLGQFDTAIIELEECIDYTPEHKLALFCLGRSYLHANKLKDLKNLLDTDLSKFQNTNGFNLLKGSLFLAKGDTQNALPHLFKAMKNNNNMAVLLQIAKCYYISGDLEKATATIYKIISREPRIGSAHELLALIYIRQGRTKEALEEFEKVSKKGSSALAAQTGKSILYRVLEGKLSDYSVVSYYQAKSIPMFNNLKSLYEKIEILEEISEKSDLFPEAFLELAVTCNKAANSTKANHSKELRHKAAEYLKLATKSKYTDHQTWYRMGLYFMENNENKNAEESFTKAIKIDSQFALAHLRLSQCHLNEKKFEKAFYHACRTIELSPLNSKAYKFAGIALIKQGKINEGQKFMSDNEMLNPYDI